MTDVEPHVFVDGDDPSPPRCVVVEGPECGDAAFLGAWLTAAGEAETLWKRANEGPDFIKQIDRVILFSIPDFGIRACSFVMRLKEPRITSLVVRLENEDADDFPMMAEMGFFERAGGHYRMAIPSRLTLATVKAGAHAYAATETENERDGPHLHPEHLVATMSLAEATARQARLQAVQDFKYEGYPGPHMH
jgi:hypothetical protein